MNRFEFLKNYKDFGCRIRYLTAVVVFNELATSKDPENCKALMLRIIEDLVASTEDLAMWLVAVHSRNDGDKRYRDEWERLLTLEVSHNQPKKILSEYSRIKTVKGFLKKMNFLTINQLANRMQQGKTVIKEAVEAIRFTAETAIKQRSDYLKIVDRTHNKIKHGMMVYSTLGKNQFSIRDFSVKLAGSSRRVSRKNRIIDIWVDIPKAKRMVGTIKANAQGIEALINLLLMDYEYRIKSGGIKMHKKNKDRCLIEIKKALS